MLMSTTFVVCKTALNIDRSSKDELICSVNPYIGCLHQCRYCYVRAEKYSKNENLNVVKIKYNIIDVLIKQLAKCLKIYPTGVVYLGTSSDPYQSIEKEYKLSHKILTLILNHTPYNVHIFTKSPYILDDLEILKQFKERINVSFTIITVNEKIKNIFEPNTVSIKQRLECIKNLRKEEINCGCSLMPILPYINDNFTSLNTLLYELKQYNCSYIWWGYLSLRENLTNKRMFKSQKELYYDILKQNFPHLVSAYDKLYKNRILPNKEYQRKIDHRIICLAKKYNLPYTGPQWKKVTQQLFLSFNY